MVAIAMPAFAQQGRLSPHDQSEFDKYYAKWVNDTRKNDRDDIAEDVKHMQEIMGRNGIPSNVPYEQIASTDNESQPALIEAGFPHTTRASSTRTTPSG